MQEAQQQIHQILTQNQGNRLTFELINGLTARLQMIVSEYGQRVSEPLQKELAELREQAASVLGQPDTQELDNG